MGSNGKQSYNTIGKRVAKFGMDIKNMTPEDWVRFYKLEAGEEITDPGTQPKIEPASTFTLNDIEQIINSDKKREGFKDTEPKVDHNNVNYVDLDTDEEKQKQKSAGEKTEAQKEEEEFQKMWEGFDGEMLIWGIENINVELVPILCKRFNRQLPDPQDVLFKERTKMLMRPGANIYMQRIIRLLKRPEYLFLAAWGVHLTGLVMKQPKKTNHSLDGQNDL